MPKLLEQVRTVIRTRHYSLRTEQTYIQWIKQYIIFNSKRHPSDLGAEEVSAFLSHLAVSRKVAASTQNQALAAILFLYRHVLKQELPWLQDVERAKRPVRVPLVFTREEIRAVRSHLSHTTWLMASLLYGPGLRLNECLSLRVGRLFRSGLQRRASRICESHQRKLVDGSDPTYKTGAGEPWNPPNGSWGMVQIQPTKQVQVKPWNPPNGSWGIVHRRIMKLNLECVRTLYFGGRI